MNLPGEVFYCVHRALLDSDKDKIGELIDEYYHLVMPRG